MLENLAKRSGVQAAGDRPDAFKPCSVEPSHMIANASLPTPLLVGSTIVSVIAAASAASTALPPRSNARIPASTAKGCEVATILRPNTGERREGYGRL